MARGGWYKQYRAIFDHPVLSGDVASRVHAFSDLVGMAEHTATKRRVGSVLVELQRGEFLASVRYLAERWSWSKAKVQRFLGCLERESMVSTVSETASGTVYLVVNYDAYQGAEDGDRDTKRDGDGTPTGQARDKVEEVKNTPTTTTTREAEVETAKVEMWADFDARTADLPAEKRTTAQHRARGIINGDTATAWQDQTGTQVPWAERPRLFRLAWDEWEANGGKLHNILRLVVIPREFDPFPQRKSTDPAPGSEATAVGADPRREKPGQYRGHARAEPEPVAVPYPSQDQTAEYIRNLTSTPPSTRSLLELVKRDKPAA